MKKLKKVSVTLSKKLVSPFKLFFDRSGVWIATKEVMTDSLESTAICSHIMFILES